MGVVIDTDNLDDEDWNPLLLDVALRAQSFKSLESFEKFEVFWFAIFHFF
jgi:hypothetical protein